MPLATRCYVIGVCDDCGRPSPDWGLQVSAPRVFTAAPGAREGLFRLGWTITTDRGRDNDGATDRRSATDGGCDRVWCPPCVCRRNGHDLTRLRRGRRSCRCCGTAWHTAPTRVVTR